MARVLRGHGDAATLATAGSALRSRRISRSVMWSESCNRMRKIMATALTADRVIAPYHLPLAAPRPRADATLSPGATIASWRVDGELGRGGMATVYSVTHRKFGKSAAIKLAHRTVLGASFTADTFVRELRVARSVDHPGVVRVYASGSHDDVPYLVMERLRGVSLGRLVDRGPIARARALEWLIELCDILRAAHRAGIVHRDLKLDNVMICRRRRPGEGMVKLVDWGVAHVAGEDDPFRGLIAGTLVYVAPEQVRGEPITPAADIYSLAVLAYHLLCRRPPFQSPSDLDLISMHLRCDPPRASVAWPGIPAGLDALLLRMLAKSPDERPTLDEVEHTFRDALEPLVGEPSFRVTIARTRRAQSEGVDPFGRIELPAPPLRVGWVALAVGLSGLAALLHALPF
jgi:serine/threonine protein kinase